jgi:flavin-dependent dehydrogenase
MERLTNGASTSLYDLIVIGGGPAGSAAALTAERAGSHVLLLEGRQFPRHKVCGEFVSAESLGLLGSLLHGTESVSLLEAGPRIGAGRLFVDGTVLDVPVDPPAASIARYDLDAALWKAAQQAGVDARQQQNVLRISGNGPFLVETSMGQYEGRALIDASGRWSNLRDRPPANGRRNHAKWLGLKAHFLEDRPAASVDLYFFQGGYCGVQPVRDSQAKETRLNVSAMVRADVASSLTEVFRQHSELRNRSLGWQQVTDLVATSPLIFRTPEPTRDNVLLAGDAAGFVDPFVGDGISLALRSGVLAGESLQPFLAGACTLATASRRYRDMYRRTLLPIFRNSSMIRRLFSLPAPMRTGLLLLVENSPWLLRYMVRRTR